MVAAVVLSEMHTGMRVRVPCAGGALTGVTVAFETYPDGVPGVWIALDSSEGPTGLMQAFIPCAQVERECNADD
jgi:hypothetical protein